MLHGTEVHCDRVCFSALHSEANSIPISAQLLTLHHGRQDQFALKESQYLIYNVDLWKILMISLPKQFSHTPIKMDSLVKSLPAVRETQFQSLSQEDTLEKEMATHSSISAWESPWTGQPGGLQSMGLQKSVIQLSCQTTIGHIALLPLYVYL